jgi:hypothetical protein
MPIREIDYSSGAGKDIHLIWGEQSRDLRVEAIVFTEVLASGSEALVWAKTYLDRPGTDVSLEFRPLFKAVDGVTEWRGFGIRVNKLSGVVSFDPGPPPAEFPPNFIIEAVITRNDGGSAPAGISPALIRVHVHPGAIRMWLTPDPMTVRRLTDTGADDTESRFTVRVEFSDGVVGDLTTDHGVSWGPAGRTHGSGRDAGRLKIPATTAAGAKLQVDATWMTPTGPQFASAKMRIAAPWASDAAMPKARLIDGHPDTWTGTIKPETVPNVLIFGDGFTAADVAAFEGITNRLVHDLKTDPLTRPYDRLATSMNFWRVMVPADRRGVSVRCEVNTELQNGKLMARVLPPAHPPPPTDPWKLQNLIYMAGLPLPADAAVPAPVLRLRWGRTMRALPPLNVDDALIERWRSFSTRQFIDEIDAFPAMALGSAPAAAEQSNTPLLELHPDRGGETGLGAFFRALAASNNVSLSAPPPDHKLGRLWAEDDPSFLFDNRPLVVALAGFEGGRANRGDRIHQSLKTSVQWMPVATVVGRKALTLDGTVALSAAVDRDVWRAIAHELGHSFGLDDEYVDTPGSFTKPESTLDGWGNVTTEAAVRDSGGKIRAGLIKWNWRRARKAAILRDFVIPSGSNFLIKVRRGQAFQFAAGDKVWLRAREPKKVIKGSTFECSTELTVVSHNAAGDELIVSGSPNLLELVFFKEESIVYASVKLADGSEARMIAPKIAKFMEDNDRPLTPKVCDVALQVAFNAAGDRIGSLPQIPAYDGYDGFWSHRNDVRVVGLYAGGDQQGCGIFHPAGACMMRNAHSETSQFCAVCQFVMVEMIDPNAHWWIDRDYAAQYPS